MRRPKKEVAIPEREYADLAVLTALTAHSGPLTFEELARRITDTAEELNRLARIAAQRSDMVIEAYIVQGNPDRCGRVEYSIARRIMTSAGFKHTVPRDAIDIPV